MLLSGTLDQMVLLISAGHYSHHYTMNERCVEYVRNI